MPRPLFFAPFEVHLRVEVHFRAGGEPHAPSPSNQLHYYCPSLPPTQCVERDFMGIVLGLCNSKIFVVLGASKTRGIQELIKITKT